jgi:hypothetical protein
LSRRCEGCTSGYWGKEGEKEKSKEGKRFNTEALR